MNFIHQLHLWDREATLAINALHSPVTDRIWILFSHRWIWCIMYAVVVFFLFRRLHNDRIQSYVTCRLSGRLSGYLEIFLNPTHLVRPFRPGL